MWLKACVRSLLCSVHGRQIYLSVVLTSCFYVSLDNQRLLPADRMVFYCNYV